MYIHIYIFKFDSDICILILITYITYNTISTSKQSYEIKHYKTRKQSSTNTIIMFSSNKLLCHHSARYYGDPTTEHNGGIGHTPIPREFTIPIECFTLRYKDVRQSLRTPKCSNMPLHIKAS